MNDTPPPETLVPLAVGGMVALAASLAVWTWIVRRAVRREPVVPYQPRRPVPWQGIDLVLVVLFFFIALGAIVDLDRWLLWGGAPAGRRPAQTDGPALTDRPALADGATQTDEAGPTDRPAQAVKPSTDHAVIVLLREDRRLTTLALCILAAAVVAPIVEEVFFRLLVQGWLEAVERRWRRRLRFSRGALRGAFPVLVSSLVFALTHCRRPEMPPSPDVVLHGLACQMFANVATLGFALALVSVRAGATPVDLGFCRRELVRDIGLGLGAALAVVPWIYAINILLTQLVPEGVPADPYTLILFAAVLGLLYYRTHRIVPSIVLHAALNAASVALAWSVLTPAK